MVEGDKPLTPAGNIKRPSIPVVIGWVKTTWERIPEEMVRMSDLNCGISNKMDGTKDHALDEVFLGKVLLKLRRWRTMTAMLIIITILLLHMRFRTTAGPAFSRIKTMILIWGNFNHIIRKITFCKNWQGNTSEVDLDLYREYIPEKRITGSKIDLDLSTSTYLLNLP